MFTNLTLNQAELLLKGLQQLTPQNSQELNDLLALENALDQLILSLKGGE